MLSVDVRHKYLAGAAAFLFAALLAHPVYAEVTSAPTAADMIQNIADQIPSLMRFVAALAYVMGMYFIFFAILKLKQYGEMRTMMASQHSLKGPIIYLIVGALLIYLPSSIQMGTSTFWAHSSPYEYVGAESDQWASLLKACILVVQLFGTIAFIRGLVLLSHMGGHGGQPGMFGKAMTHVIGGIFCINIYAFVQMVLATLGLNIGT